MFVSLKSKIIFPTRRRSGYSVFFIVAYAARTELADCLSDERIRAASQAARAQLRYIERLFRELQIFKEALF